MEALLKASALCDKVRGLLHAGVDFFPQLCGRLPEPYRLGFP